MALVDTQGFVLAVDRSLFGPQGRRWIERKLPDVATNVAFIAVSTFGACVLVFHICCDYNSHGYWAVLQTPKHVFNAVVIHFVARALRWHIERMLLRSFLVNDEVLPDFFGASSAGEDRDQGQSKPAVIWPWSSKDRSDSVDSNSDHDGDSDGNGVAGVASSPGRARFRRLRSQEMAQGNHAATISASPAGAALCEDDYDHNLEYAAGAAAAGVGARSAKGGDANNQSNIKNFPGLFGACRPGQQSPSASHSASFPLPSPRLPQQHQQNQQGNGSVSLDHRRHSVEPVMDKARADDSRADEGEGGGKGVEVMKQRASWSAGGGRETNGNGATPTPASSKTRFARCGSISDDGDGNGDRPGGGNNEGGGRGPRGGVGGGIRRRLPRRTSLSPDDHLEDREDSRRLRGRQRELVEDRVGGGAGVWGSIGQPPGAGAGGGGGGGRTWRSIDTISKALRSSRRRGLRQTSFYTEADIDELMENTIFIKMCDDASWLYVEDRPHEPELNWLLLLRGGSKIVPRFPGEVRENEAPRMLFKCEPGRNKDHVRIRSTATNTFLYFLGIKQPLTWVAWNRNVTGGDWEDLKLEWVGKTAGTEGVLAGDERGRVVLRSRPLNAYVSWNGTRFTHVPNREGATVFMFQRVATPPKSGQRRRDGGERNTRKEGRA